MHALTAVSPSRGIQRMSYLLKVQLATVHAAHTASPTMLDKHLYTRQLPTARRQGDTGQNRGDWVVPT